MSHTEAKSTANATQTSEQQPNQSDVRTSGDELLHELDRLGSQIVDMVRAAWNSEQRKQIEGDVVKGLGIIAASIDEGVKKISESNAARDLLDKAEKVISNTGEQLRSSPTTQELIDALRRGIQRLNDQLAKAAAEMEGKSGGNKPSAQSQTEVQEIKVEQEKSSEA
jgi:uncharacterized protein YaaR (DUF327 family)